ncbi:MAG: carboxyl transferase domain-containing protein [Waddliaceae bacterium]
MIALKQLTKKILEDEQLLHQGGGKKGRERQKKLGRLTARERLKRLFDSEDYFELGLFQGWKMYAEWGEFPAAGVLACIGKVSGRTVMVIANDATVKAGAMMPQSVKKMLRAQRIAYESRLPILYLVDSAGVFLPLQDEIFPDEDDFGRIFRNNAVLSANGIPQIAAIMGSCIAGGGYLPVLCDQLLMTEGSGLYLAGPALVKQAIGQDVGAEELGGAKMHAAISGTVDFLEPNDESCLNQMRKLVDMLPEDTQQTRDVGLIPGVYDLPEFFDIHELLNLICDEGTIIEYKAEYGKAIVCVEGKIGGIPIGVIANQKKQTRGTSGEVHIGGVLYSESAEKAARFVMDCNQMQLPILFLQDVVGFMVGKEAEQGGIIKSGAKLVNAVSNSIVPKITLIIGSSFGAGNYALCGKAYDPNFILAWPNAKYAVMGASQAAGTLYSLQKDQKVFDKVFAEYNEQTDIRYGAARGWVDAIIAPHRTRQVLFDLLQLVKRAPKSDKTFHTGVIQV